MGTMGDTVTAFGTYSVRSCRPRTFLNLEDRVARMVDEEYYRITHKKEYEENYKKKTTEDKRQFIRDKRLADSDPEKYCADRCLSTGSCEVYEDFFKMSAEQVVEFCSDCVLSDDEEPCDIPEGFYGFDDDDDAVVANGDLRP